MSGFTPIPEIELTPAPITMIGEQLSPSPWQYRFTGEDALEIAAYNSQSGVRIAVQGRMWHEREGIRPFRHTHVPNSDRTRSIEVFGLPFGYLLNAVVFAEAGAPRVGQTFISLHVIRGGGQARVLLATLLQGYVTAEQELAFPGSAIESSLAGGGVPRLVLGTNPAPGASMLEVVPAGARWRLNSLYIVLTTSATVAPRTARLEFGYEGNNIVSLGAAITQAASLDYGYTWGEGLPTSPAVSGIYVNHGLPQDLWLPAGASIATNAVNFQPGDNWSTPIMMITELLEAQ
jgi:hypothetical protein